MTDTRITKKMLTAEMGMVRRRGRPTNRWMVAVRKDLRKKLIHNWMELVKNKEEWKRRIKKWV